MRRADVTLNVSLDGFADHTVAVVAGDELQDLAREMLESADTVLSKRPLEGNPSFDSGKTETVIQKVRFFPNL